MTLAIRAARLEDRAAARELLAAQLAEHALPIEPLDRALDGALADPSRAAVLLAFDGARAIGVAFVSFVWTLEHGGRAAWLEELYVVPERRGAGAGGRLLDAVIALCRDAGCAALDLEVEKGHARAANLYLRAGFRAHTRSRFVKPLV